MLTKAVGQSCATHRTRELRPGRYALGALIVIGSVACTESVVPVTPGSILVSTETTGFLKDDGYELIVDGEVQGVIGANDQITISGLDPATYEVDLGDVAENCAVESSSVPVVSEATAEVSLTVGCTFAAPAPYTIQFNRERPNLDNGEVMECPFGLCPSPDEWDLYVYNSSQTDPHSVIRQNQSTAVEISHLPGVVLDDLTEGDFELAAFTTELVSEAFDSGRVILIRTDVGTVYALGNPVEDTFAQTLTFDAALIAQQ
jgi:hypothetical protein